VVYGASLKKKWSSPVVFPDTILCHPLPLGAKQFDFVLLTRVGHNLKMNIPEEMRKLTAKVVLLFPLSPSDPLG
jgi:hypothetical protein